MPSPSSAAASSSSASSAHDDLVARAIEAGIASHAELPARVRAALPASEWKARARHLLVRRGAAWGSSAAARGCCGEREYYEALVKHYLESKRVRRKRIDEEKRDKKTERKETKTQRKKEN